MDSKKSFMKLRVFSPHFLQPSFPSALTLSLCFSTPSSAQHECPPRRPCLPTYPYSPSLLPTWPSLSTTPAHICASHILGSSPSSSPGSHPDPLSCLFRESCDHPSWVLSETWGISRVYVWLWWWWDFPRGYGEEGDGVAASRIWTFCQLWGSGCPGQYGCDES